ncbi:glycoside hydrolase family 78 protein [Paenarthrobacter sp. TYUT067]|uniref:alpha-L-rhamnosidase n=1 Tax=Paenarthrobacter sp. TYUT067 TaxID=2926245 RepID=UPI00202FB02E|nr:alpha-L-rhamnosidase [Paenarthrobacter sp. TYUT067]MCM0616894.1 glycoside hydrolase family 78 protein [Paenarthrobacter sp. TYUT067]
MTDSTTTLPVSASPLEAANERVRKSLAHGSWVQPTESGPFTPGSRPAYLLRAEFTVQDLQPAWLTATAHGMYEVFINGARVDQDELKPGFSSYRRRLPAQRYDVGRLLRQGLNVVGVILSDGWFRGRHGFERRADGFGTETGVLLSIETGAGPIAVSGADWLSRESWIQAADLMDGQREDRRLYDAEWADVGADLSAWQPVAVTGSGAANPSRLVAEDRPPIRRIETLPPRETTWNADGSVVVDFGQNINGWVRLSTLGPCGTQLTLKHGEHMAGDGQVNTDHLRAFRFSDRTLLEAGQIDQVTSNGAAGDVFEPRHTTHGFRYVQIDGYPEPMDLGIEAVVVHSDLPRAGRFITSDEELAALHDSVEWSFRGNACGVPSDCPQRERSGFTGDWQVFVETASRMFDVVDFSRSWLRDLATDQWADGRVPTVIPNPAGDAPSGIAFEDMSAGSAGWGDAAVLVPWELWRRTGDASILAESFPAMQRWVDFAAGAAAAGRHPDRVASRPDARPHEQYLWDTGFHFGEWLEPGVTPNPDPRTDHGIVATAFLHRSAHLLALTADVLDKRDAAERYRSIAAGALGAWREEYLLGNGKLAVDSQATYTRALAFGLLPENQRAAAAAHLAHLVEAAGNTVGTGFLSTGQLLPALADHGQAAAAMRLLRSHQSPSWLAMLDRGATTMWEWWNGVDGTKVSGSLNHYSKGAVASFLHTHVAGLRLPSEPSIDDAGGRLILIEPVAIGTLATAEAHLDFPVGRASVAWSQRGETAEITVIVPHRAALRLPDGTTRTLSKGTHTIHTDITAQRGA